MSRLIDRNEGMSLWDKYLPSRHNSSYSTSVIIRSVIGMMAAGYSNFSDVEKLHSDSLFKMVTGDGCVSQETFRQRLDTLAGRKWQDVLDSCVASQLRMAMLTRVDVLGQKLVGMRALLEISAPARSNCQLPTLMGNIAIVNDRFPIHIGHQT